MARNNLPNMKASTAQLEARLGRYSSGAAGVHADKRTKRHRTRASRKQQALRDQER